MKRKPCQWNRRLWGIEFRNSRGDRLLLGSLWDDDQRERAGHLGEPGRALLFCTRAQARAWCARERAKFVDYPKDHICIAWRFRAVRVRETVQVIA